MECRMDHIVLNVTEMDAVVSFYTGVLGLAAERLEEYRGGKVPFPSVRLGRHTIIDLFPKRMWQQSAGADTGHINMNHFCLALQQDDWQALRDRLEENGVNIEDGPVPRWGAHGTGTSIYFRDPENNLIEARYYENQNDTATCLLGS